MIQRKTPAKRAYVPGLGGTHHVDETVKMQQPPANSLPIVALVGECGYHKEKLPCAWCESNETYRLMALRWELRRQQEETMSAALAASWFGVVKSAGIDPKSKCLHGHYLHEFYCDVCRLAPVDPDYNPDVYRTEIRKALGKARRSLYGDEGAKDFKDLQRIIDIEVWKACKKYGDQMNEKLAYSIASSQAGKYLTERIEEQSVESTDVEGNAIRIPRFVSMDDKPEDEEGNPMESAAEIAVIGGPVQEVKLETDPEALRPLIAQWHGSKRKVAEAMLLPDFTVRGVPGVDRNMVFRLRKIILENFKSFLLNKMKGEAESK